ncbi:MAG: hypothetical protein UT34_C0001G0486 [candidate division WS6 bacterium GW2011_GWF2_39_15]|uniref:DUF304 domain-containing protein n=1 Tax=candidate division WS6 bacterium GW2011_GWF2_39_15 TaxID=1619100 RepID=A0A0G0Q7L7_9BACT|nr:MAG: hypothetical protein UT34_C0001G0486 [candidate division WS6 bacterium GW2011_GWF2_39_15]
MGHIPKKFLKGKKSFIANLSSEAGTNRVGSFGVFPTNISFNGQDKGESVVLVVRRHPAVFIPQYFLILVLLFAPVLVLSVFRDIEGLNFAFALGVGTLFLLLAISTAIDTFLKWYYSVNIVTDQRIIDVDFNNVLFHRFSEAQLEKIEDVSHAPSGLLSSIFDYGDVYIQTAGTKPEFEFTGVPRPRDIQDTLLDLLELKQKGQI